MKPGWWFHFQPSTCKTTQPVAIKITFLNQDSVSRNKRSLQGKFTLASNLQQIFFFPMPCAGKDSKSSIIIAGHPHCDSCGHCRSCLRPGQASSCYMTCSKCNSKSCHCIILLFPMGKLEEFLHWGCFKQLWSSARWKTPGREMLISICLLLEVIDCIKHIFLVACKDRQGKFFSLSRESFDCQASLRIKICKAAGANTITVKRGRSHAALFKLR